MKQGDLWHVCVCLGAGKGEQRGRTRRGCGGQEFRASSDRDPWEPRALGGMGRRISPGLGVKEKRRMSPWTGAALDH